MILFSGLGSEKLAMGVASGTNAEHGDIRIKRFPDGEFYIRILSDVKGKECAVIKSTDSNDAMVELFIILDAIRDMGASRISAIVPYLAYARQDKRFNEGEALSAKTILGLIKKFSDTIMTVNCHFLHSSGESEFQGIEIRNLDAFPLLTNYFMGKLKNPFILAPDKGSIGLAKKTSEIIGCEFDFINKIRISGDDVMMETKEMDLKNRDVIILDDIISTGGTIVQAANFARSNKAKSINVGCVHGIFSRGLDKLNSVADEIVCTDTIQREISRVSVADLIAGELQ